METTPTTPLFLRYSDVMELGLHHFAVDASTLGLPPGRVPRSIPTDIGNGQPFALKSASEGAFEYAQVFGCVTLSVFNS